MFKKFMALINAVDLIGYITNISMGEVYGSIDFYHGDTKYLLTLTALKEEEKNDAN